jgi:hypothetical protein
MPRRAHASQNPPAERAGIVPIDVVAGEPAVPLTVWRTPTGVGQASISPRLAERLITAYSRPGEAVVDLTEDHALAGAATVGRDQPAGPAVAVTRLGPGPTPAAVVAAPQSGATPRKSLT